MLQFTNLNEGHENAYEGFKSLYGMRDVGGNNVRKNKILLEYVKFYHNDPVRARTSSMSEMKTQILSDLKQRVPSKESNALVKLFAREDAISMLVCSTDMAFDERYGITSGMYLDSVRYVFTKKNYRKIYMCKSGKFASNIIESNLLTARLPEKVKIWICEEFSKDWAAYVERFTNNRFTLHHGSRWGDFIHIYSSEKQYGNFHSCMNDEERADFYVEAVDASAAWITNTDGQIVARCVIFNNAVRKSDGKVFRLAERQYASESFEELSNDQLKRILVQKLYKEGLIDGNKIVGVNCHDITAYEDCNGCGIESPFFKTKLNVENWRDANYLSSYQDTFIYVTKDDDGFYLTNDIENSIEGIRLDKVDECTLNFDSYNGCYTFDRLVKVIAPNNNYTTCSGERLEDFELINGVYVYKGLVRTCKTCGRKFVYGIDIGNGMEYCCDECLPEGNTYEEAVVVDDIDYDSDGLILFGSRYEAPYPIRNMPQIIRDGIKFCSGYDYYRAIKHKRIKIETRSDCNEMVKFRME